MDFTPDYSTVIFILHPLLVYCNTFLIINIIKTKKSIAECTKIQMMLIIAFLNTLSPDTIAVELTVALATKHRMQQELIGDRLLELSRYISINSISKTLIIDKTSLIRDGYQVTMH